MKLLIFPGAKVKLMSNGIPERCLLGAILERAIWDVVGRASIEDRKAAIRWFNNRKPGDEGTPFSFPWICEHLEVNEDYIRKTVLSKTHKYGRATNQNRIDFHQMYDAIISLEPDQFQDSIYVEQSLPTKLRQDIHNVIPRDSKPGKKYPSVWRRYKIRKAK